MSAERNGSHRGPEVGRGRLQAAPRGPMLPSAPQRPAHAPVGYGAPAAVGVGVTSAGGPQPPGRVHLPPSGVHLAEGTHLPPQVPTASEAGRTAPAPRDQGQEVRRKLDEIRTAVEKARSLPMSASCIVNRKELLASLAEAQRLLPTELAEARAVLEQREAAVEAGRAEAARLVEEARRERQAMIRDTDIYRDARRSADELLAEARTEAEGLRREVDDYVDQKLASFEIAIHKTLGTVAEGRQQLRGNGGPRREAPMSRQEVDDYIDQTLRRFEHSLHKTLDAVTRGRDRLRDRSGLDTTFTADDDAPPLPG